MSDFSARVIRKAEALRRRGDVRQDSAFPEVWWVTPEGHRLPYRVQVLPDGGATCTCEHGQKQGAGACRCYHVAAVILPT